jgi:hypothetical protein
MSSTEIQRKRMDLTQNVKTFALGALALGALAAPAAADPVPYGTTYGANARAEAGSQVDPIFSQITVVNGVETLNVTNQSDGGGGVTGSGQNTDSSTSFAPKLLSVQTGTWANGPNTATTSASSNLANGTIHLSIGGTGPLRLGTPSGSASGTLGDLVTFDNTTGGVVDLGVSFSLHGTFTQGPYASPNYVHEVTAGLDFKNYNGVTYPSTSFPGVQLMNPSTSVVGAILGTFYTEYQYQGQYQPLYTAFGNNGGAPTRSP